MKKNNANKNKNAVINRVKRVYYETRSLSLKTILITMTIGGILLSGTNMGKVFYINSASSSAKAELFYKEISDAQYPDKSRFTYYDFADIDRIEKALELVQQKGIYKGFTAEELRDSFKIYSYLDSSVRDNVEYLRSEGSDYSYVANEYGIVFTQPHDYDDENVLNRFFPKDYSKEFLEALMHVNYTCFLEDKGGAGGFDVLTDVADVSGYDYGEKVEIYRTGMNSAIDALNSLDASGKFTSKKYNITIKDLVGEYKLLKTELNSIADFVETSALTKDLEVQCNKLKTNLETNELKFNKSLDRYNINKLAQDSYDHTFTENLIIVTLHEYDGLYQARPKTAFDRVAVQKHSSMEDKAYFASKINNIQTMLTKYQQTSRNTEEYKRLCEKCEQLQAEFENRYLLLTNKTNEMVAEYYNMTNQDFMEYKVQRDNIINKDFIFDNAFVFAIGAASAFVLLVAGNSLNEYSKHKKKEKMLNQLLLSKNKEEVTGEWD